MNNTTNATAIATLPAFGGVETWFRLVAFFIILCAGSATGNVIVILCTTKTEEMRTSRFFAIVRHLCFTRAMTCLQFCIMGLYQCLRVAAVVSVVQPYTACLALFFWLTFGLMTEMLLLIFMAMDRIVAIAFPLKYWTIGTKQASLLCVIIAVFCCCVRVGHALLVSDVTQPVVCATVFSVGSESSSIASQTTDNGLLAILIILQLSLMIYVRCRSRRAPGTEAERDSIQRHMTLLPILRNQVLLHCGIQILSKTILLLTQVVIDPIWNGRLMAYGSTLVTLDIFVNTCALLLNQDIRAQWQRWMSPRAVMSIRVSSMTKASQESTRNGDSDGVTRTSMINTFASVL